MGGTGLEPVTPSLSSPQSCYSALAGTPSFWPVCRTVRTLPGAAFALVLGLRSPLLLAPVSTVAAASSRREPVRPPRLPGRRRSPQIDLIADDGSLSSVIAGAGYGQTSTTLYRFSRTRDLVRTTRRPEPSSVTCPDSCSRVGVRVLVVVSNPALPTRASRWLGRVRAGRQWLAEAREVVPRSPVSG